MRYQENRTVEDVLHWLTGQNCEIAPRSYHRFMARVLRLLPLDRAKHLGIDVDLLRAVRVRYKMAVNPKRGQKAGSKHLPPHHARARRRRILPRSNPKPIRAPLGPPGRGQIPPVVAPTPLPLVGTASPPAQSEPPKLYGTMEKPKGHGDWRVINEMARKKVFAVDRLVLLNYKGIVMHNKTRREYTQTDLENEFGLTPNEAESCFMTFTDDPRRI